MTARQMVTIEISAEATASVSSDDYGVPGSPVFDTFDDIDVTTIEINGKEYTKADLAGKDAWAWIQDLMIESTEVEAWEIDEIEPPEPDYDDD